MLTRTEDRFLRAVEHSNGNARAAHQHFAAECPELSRQGRFDSLLEEFAVNGWVREEGFRLYITHEGRKALDL